MKYKDYAVTPQAGRFVKEDGTIINLADVFVKEDGTAVNLAELFENIDVSTTSVVSKGTTVTTHSAVSVTTTSAAIDTTEVSVLHISVLITGTGTWTISLQGSADDTDYVDEYVNGAQVIERSLTVSKNFAWPCYPKYAKIVATEDVDGATITIYVTPIGG